MMASRRQARLRGTQRAMDSGEKLEIGSLRGIPILICPSLLLLVVLYTQADLMSGDPRRMSMGLLIAAGVFFSILVHEFAHAFVARRYGTDVSHVELNGLGGLCFFAGSLPAERSRRIIILLAGPCSNLVLWVVFCTLWRETAEIAATSGDAAAGLLSLAHVFWWIGQANFFMLVFNLLPAHPLDGGRAATEALAPYLGAARSQRVVAFLGLGVAGLTAVGSYFFGPFMLMLAAVLYLNNAPLTNSDNAPHRGN